ncbi:MAG: GntR family transcriptional regulator [Nocardiopsaceae bacterium]|jgi:DNA-binding GntR family transcriptional regulator|nr:GntR family transcriptional regulator [Nocardiopsaceae bacterium]
MTRLLADVGTTIQRQSTSGQAAAAIRDAILSGQIPPGTPLRETALATELAVSRNTIREAARILEAEGLVLYQMNRGIVVTEITADDVRDIYAARSAAELAGVNALTANRDSAIYKKLAGLVERIEKAHASSDTTQALEGDRLFHATLVSAVASPRLSRFHAQLQQEQRLALALAEQSSRQLGRTADDHRELLEALRGSRSWARAQLTKHLRTGEGELQRLVELLAQREDG